MRFTLHSNITDSEIQTYGHHIARRDRKRQGGGVTIYIKEKWALTNVWKFRIFEMIIADIRSKMQHSRDKKWSCVLPPD